MEEEEFVLPEKARNEESVKEELRKRRKSVFLCVHVCVCEREWVFLSETPLALAISSPSAASCPRDL